jgi:hypothetical protein
MKKKEYEEVLEISQELRHTEYEDELKEFILFGYCQYYPSGGLSDIMGSFDSLEEARSAIVNDLYPQPGTPAAEKHPPRQIHDAYDVIRKSDWSTALTAQKILKEISTQ